MDSRSAAHVLSQIGALLEAKGEQRFKARAYRGAARALIAIDTDDLAPLVRSGELADTPGIGPATLSVVRELVETGESSYLNRSEERRVGKECRRRWLRDNERRTEQRRRTDNRTGAQ